MDTIKGIGLRPGKPFTNMMKILDRKRIANAEPAQQELEKETSRHKHGLEIRLEDHFKEKERQEP